MEQQRRVRWLIVFVGLRGLFLCVASHWCSRKQSSSFLSDYIEKNVWGFVKDAVSRASQWTGGGGGFFTFSGTMKACGHKDVLPLSAVNQDDVTSGCEEVETQQTNPESCSHFKGTPPIVNRSVFQFACFARQEQYKNFPWFWRSSESSERSCHWFGLTLVGSVCCQSGTHELKTCIVIFFVMFYCTDWTAIREHCCFFISTLSTWKMIIFSD